MGTFLKVVSSQERGSHTNRWLTSQYSLYTGTFLHMGVWWGVGVVGEQ